MTVRLQEWIHRFEEGAGNRATRLVLVLVAMSALAVFYNLAAFKNLPGREGMDAAQLARNIADGKGFTTDFIRPLSLQLVYERATNRVTVADADAIGSVTALWASRIKERHPDLAHPPVYPLLLAGVLKLNPFGYPDTTGVQNFAIHTPDLWIAMFNQLLLILATWMVFRLALKLFDEPVAWVAAVLFYGSELFWRFTMSGTSSLTLILVFLGSMHLLAAMERSGRAQPILSRRLLRLAVGLGLMTGLGTLTRYSYGWLIVPVCVALASLPVPKRAPLVLATIASFLLVVSPWFARNYSLSGQLLGVAGYTVFQETASFPGDDLERSSHPDFREFTALELVHKLFKSTRQILQKDLPGLGGNWVVAFFLVGLLVPFRNPVLSALRNHLLLCLGILMVVQALGRTSVQEEMPDINTGNLLVILAPVIMIFGASLFFQLLNQFGAQSQAIRYTIAGSFCLILSGPLVLTFLPPHASPVAFPPYYPPWIQEKSAYLNASNPEEAIMSDIPWAVAWYGRKPGIWLSRQYKNPETARYRNDYFEIANNLRPVTALYISKKTMDKVNTQSLIRWIARPNPEDSWEDFVLDWEAFILIGIYLNNEIPTGFPLKNAPTGIYPELFLTDSEHNHAKVIQ